METRDENGICPICTFSHIDDIYVDDDTLIPGQSLPQTTYNGQQTSISLSFSLTCSSLLGPNCDDLCLSLDPPTNGRVVQPDVIVEGSMATYFCDTGYILIGDLARECQSGVWSRSAPICECEYTACAHAQMNKVTFSGVNVVLCTYHTCIHV